MLNRLHEAQAGCLFHFRRSLPLKLRTEAPSPDDCVLAKLLPHRIEGLVDLALGGGCGTEEVALTSLAGRGQIVNS